MIFNPGGGQVAAAVIAIACVGLPWQASAEADSVEPLVRPDLRMLVPVAARDLARHTGPLVLDAVVALPVESAAAPAPHRGWLSLGSLESLDEKLAAALARHSGPLVLDGLLILPPRSAAALSTLRQPLSVGLLALPPETAAALAGHRGVLVLSRLESLSSEAARVLAAHRGPIAFPRLAELSYGAAIQLLRLPHPLSFDVLGGPAGDPDPLMPLEKPWISAGPSAAPR
jgi:hypothetical protein